MLIKSFFFEMYASFSNKLLINITITPLEVQIFLYNITSISCKVEFKIINKFFFNNIYVEMYYIDNLTLVYLFICLYTLNF